MSVEKIANRYAKSLFDEAVANNNLDTAYSDILYIQKSLLSSIELQNFFSNPIIKVASKISVIHQIFGSVVSPKTLRLLEILINNKREPYIKDIITSFVNMYDRHHNVTKVILTTAVEVDGVTLDNIKNIITAKTGYSNLVVTSKVDSAILGGFIAQVNDKVIDASVIARLKKVSNELINN
jgi:F-type H+-transporting ATPase subunit delta